MNALFSFVLFFFSFLLYTHDTTYIIIHGTWAQSQEWYQEGGDFFDTLYSLTDDSDTIISFSWSGSCFESARIVAAQQLALLFESIKTEKLICIGHSHGGNVALKAAEFLQRYALSRTIDILILLGTPHYHDFYFPKPVLFIFNFFSFGDQIQPIFNLFKRDIPDTSQSVNVSLMIEGREPDHEQLHHPLIAFHISDIIQMGLCLRESIGQTPLALHIEYGQPAQYKEDIHRNERIAADIIFQQYLPSYLLSTESLYFFL